MAKMLTNNHEWQMIDHPILNMKPKIKCRRLLQMNVTIHAIYHFSLFLPSLDKTQDTGLIKNMLIVKFIGETESSSWVVKQCAIRM